MNFKKFNGTTWETVQHKIYGSGTEQLASFPAMIQAAGEPLTDYLISGNTVQNGTPTPESPVDVVGCGEKTGNLFDKNNQAMYFNSTSLGTNNRWIVLPAGQEGIVLRIPCLPFTTYAISLRGEYVKSVWNIELTSSDNTPTKNTPVATNTITNIKPANLITVFTTFANTKYILLQLSSAYIDSGGVDNIMLNIGSTALPYEPYGYKLPITVNGTEYPIYLGQVEATRKIKKVVFNGTEPWGISGTIVYINNTDTEKISPLICTHFHNAVNTGMWNGNSWIFQVDISRLGMSGRNAWITWLAGQYAAGTPVTVWYILAEPETGVVNEPLMKIGDYADTITMAQAEVAIPTSDGDNTISFGTTVKPSAMSAAFKGWHPVQAAKQYDGNDWS